MRILFVTHTDFAVPDYLQSWALENRFELLFSKPFKGDKLPQISEFDWMILMGGTQSLQEKERYPFIKDEIDLVEKAISQNKTILGCCLGAQIIGEAYGMVTETSPEKEIGVFPVELTEDGLNDPILKGQPRIFDAVHWHRYMPGLPQSAKILATSAGCPRQMIRFSPKVYGFQCHLEVTKEDVAKAISFFEKDLEPGSFVQSKEDFLKKDFSAINRRMISILDPDCYLLSGHIRVLFL